ncbi:glycine dehydrogenase [Halobacteriales archaeon QS_5_70_15]|nr:MAG: glycine dehydrogenase [Halobacteriales archaeon QS_5_70_15]
MSDDRGSPFAPHTAAERDAMLEAVGVGSEEALFDVPEPVRFDGSLDIEPRDERTVVREVAETLGDNDDLVEFLGRGRHAHYVPSAVDHLADRSEFLTSYTQYQPEVAQGFLQALFEYQSLLVELTGLGVANCSMYDAATALGEAATLASRVRATTGDRVLVPEHLVEGRREVLENYVAGADLSVESYPMEDGAADVDALADLVDEGAVMVYAESPTVRGVIEESLAEMGTLADENEALFVLGSDLVALSVLERPVDVGADVVVGDAALGLLVGAGQDGSGRRAYTLTLQTREQHIRRERATSNICTNQAWVALRAAMHAFSLGPDGLRELANDCVRWAEDLAGRLDDVRGAKAPVHDRHHMREFLTRTDQPARAVADDLRGSGYAVHVVDEHRLQVCVTDTNHDRVDGFVDAFEEAAR